MKKFLAIVVAISLALCYAPMVFAGGETDVMTATTSVKLLETGSSPTYYTILQSADLSATSQTLTLPQGLPASIAFLKVSDAGVMTYDTAVYLTVEADTLADVTGRGASTTVSSLFQNALAVELGKDVAGGSTNIPGAMKLWSNGDNAYYTTFQAGTQTASVTYTLPLADGTNGQLLKTNGSGALSWTAASAGDITSVGDVASGAAFDGTQGTTLTFFNAGGNATLVYDGATITDNVAFAATTVNTGQGANELYAMNQDVESSDSVTFANCTVSTDFIGAAATNVYFGATATNGTWRIVRDSANLVFQVREAGNYVTKFTMIP